MLDNLLDRKSQHAKTDANSVPYFDDLGAAKYGKFSNITRIYVVSRQLNLTANRSMLARNQILQKALFKTQPMSSFSIGNFGYNALNKLLAILKYSWLNPLTGKRLSKNWMHWNSCWNNGTHLNIMAFSD